MIRCPCVGLLSARDPSPLLFTSELLGRVVSNFLNPSCIPLKKPKAVILTAVKRLRLHKRVDPSREQAHE